MKNILILFSTLFCLNVYAQFEAQEDFGAYFLHLIKSQNLDSLEILMPTTEVYHYISPEETKDKDDIRLEKFKALHKKQITKDMQNMLESAQKEKVKLKKLLFYEVEVELLPIKPLIFFSMHIHLKYGKQKLFFALSTVNMENKWYLLRVQNAKNTFELVLNR